MYDEHYGLADRPFQLTPDPRFYFDSATHRKAMAYLGYGLAQGEGFIVITGDVGTGKTTLVAHLMETIDRARLNVVQLVSTQVGADDLLRLVAQTLGLATEDVAKAQLIDRIERRLHDSARAGKRTLLVVDEAQLLGRDALEELRMLSNFQGGGQALLQIFLLGQPEFRAALNGEERLEQLRQRVIATHHLDPIGADEVGPYILHRLKKAGWTGNPAFTADAFAALHAHSAGVPRRVNMLAGRTLLMAAVEEATTIDARLVEAAAADMAKDDLAAPDRPAEAAVIDSGLADRLAQLEARLYAQDARLEEQDAVLKRVLSLLVEWIESDDRSGRYPRSVA
ncbi:XrtA/PEP-CTERM system-associated ATPase [Sphingomonas jatrophae]|uniref:Putative secretion ATPase, PEP-CTERM locus subfamily n=1 Tax=Sphingomonas jatrophae TaxID=1166337 RepID=A0A1I6JY02_9SPHN|nr:XrtA/PEP-CTERM system-associated ATPase [Sphingomonas jatrophae]SFR83410.1 putative secretion ATPase, PEP-CTERM locus subfamily [Sphingomonas jatrophae]